MKKLFIFYVLTFPFYVFGQSSMYIQEDFLKPDANIVSDDAFGTSMDSYNNTLVIGAPDDNGGTNKSGAVYVYERQNKEWVKGEDSPDEDHPDINDNPTSLNSGAAYSFIADTSLSTVEYVNMNFEIFPNPTKDHITIANTNNSAIGDYKLISPGQDGLSGTDDDIIKESKAN